MLFDGKDLSKWQNSRGQEAPWRIQDGYMETAGREGIRTRGKWADFQLHVEFTTPLPLAGIVDLQIVNKSTGKAWLDAVEVRDLGPGENR